MVLRVCNLAFFVGGLLLMRKALLAAKASLAMAHTVLFFFLLTPIAPFLAAQINYDNLLFLFASANMWLAVGVVRCLRAGELPVMKLAVLAATCMLASLVKYAYLPILLAMTVFIVVTIWRERHRIRGSGWWQTCTQNLKAYSLQARLGVLAILVVSAGLFTAMYGYNVLHYATPAPECDQVIGVERCRAYGAWNRNYNYAQHKTEVDPNPITFTRSWGAAYLNSSFFTVNGNFSGFEIGLPLPLLYGSVLLVFWAGLVVVARYARRLFFNPSFALLGWIFIVYVGTLWIQNYTEYLHLGQHVAEQGRYTLMMLPIAYLIVLSAVRMLPVWRRHPALKFAAVGMCLLVFTQGGGAVTYIVRSDEGWWWQQPQVVTANERLQKLVKPFVYTKKLRASNEG